MAHSGGRGGVDEGPVLQEAVGGFGGGDHEEHVDARQGRAHRLAVSVLGDGDLDVAGLMDRIVAGGYDGYLVVEQDVVLLERGDVERAGADQVRNRELLRRWIP